MTEICRGSDYFLEVFLAGFFLGLLADFLGGALVKVWSSSAQESRRRSKIRRTILAVSLKSRPPVRGIIIHVVTRAWRMWPSATLGARSWKNASGLGFLMADQTFMLRSKTNWSCLRAAARVRPSAG